MMENIRESATMTKVPISNKFINSKPLTELSDVSVKLTNGLLSIYQKPLEHAKKELKDLTSKQELSINQIQFENKKLCNVQEDIELNNLFSAIENCQKKLLHIKKEILIIHKRTFKLKKRALQFQQIKQKEIQHKQQQQQVQKKEQ